MEYSTKRERTLAGLRRTFMMLLSIIALVVLALVAWQIWWSTRNPDPLVVEQRAVWRDASVRSYEMDYGVSGQESSPAVRVAVRDGRVVGCWFLPWFHTHEDTYVDWADPDLESRIDRSGWVAGWTIDEVFRRATDATRTAESWSARWDPVYGFPLGIGFEPDPAVADDEWGIGIDAFAVGGRGALGALPDGSIPC